MFSWFDVKVLKQLQLFATKMLLFVAAGLAGNRIITTPSPRIAAHYAFDTQPSAFKKAMRFKRFDGVLRARRRVPA